MIVNNEKFYQIPDFYGVKGLKHFTFFDRLPPYDALDTDVDTKFDFSNIRKLTGLEDLFIGAKTISEVNFIENLENLEFLIIEGRGGENLSFDGSVCGNMRQL